MAIWVPVSAHAATRDCGGIVVRVVGGNFDICYAKIVDLPGLLSDNNCQRKAIPPTDNPGETTVKLHTGHEAEITSDKVMTIPGIFHAIALAHTDMSSHYADSLGTSDLFGETTTQSDIANAIRRFARLCDQYADRIERGDF